MKKVRLVIRNLLTKKDTFGEWHNEGHRRELETTVLMYKEAATIDVIIEEKEGNENEFD